MFKTVYFLFIVVSENHYTRSVLEFWDKYYPLRCSANTACSDCLFYRPTTLFRHYQLEHSEIGENVSCRICNKKFYTTQLLALHSIRHSKNAEVRKMYFNDALEHIFEDYIRGRYRCDAEHYANVNQYKYKAENPGRRNVRFDPTGRNRRR